MCVGVARERGFAAAVGGPGDISDQTGWPVAGERQETLLATLQTHHNTTQLTQFTASWHII